MHRFAACAACIGIIIALERDGAEVESLVDSTCWLEMEASMEARPY
jgi:hypothetical protein